MPSGSQAGGGLPQRTRPADSQPLAVIPASNDPADQGPTKQNLASWWRNFKKGNHRREDDKRKSVRITI